MLKILEMYMGGLVVAMLVLVFMCGIGYLFAYDLNQKRLIELACIEAGMQIIDGDCVK